MEWANRNHLKDVGVPKMVTICGKTKTMIKKNGCGGNAGKGNNRKLGKGRNGKSERPGWGQGRGRGEGKNTGTVQKLILPPMDSGQPPNQKKQFNKITAIVDKNCCRCCGLCVDICPQIAITMTDFIVIDSAQCTACGACRDVCPHNAISLCVLHQNAS